MTTDLSSEGCVACRRDSPSLTADEIDAMVQLVPDWRIVRVNDVPRLERTVPFTSYRESLNFTALVGELAISEDHHPVIVTEFRSVTIRWWTHAIHGLHRNDFIMASKTDALLNPIKC